MTLGLVKGEPARVGVRGERILMSAGSWFDRPTTSGPLSPAASLNQP